jgi:chromosome segregation ATPase
VKARTNNMAVEKLKDYINKISVYGDTVNDAVLELKNCVQDVISELYDEIGRLETELEDAEDEIRTLESDNDDLQREVEDLETQLEDGSKEK